MQYLVIGAGGTGGSIAAFMADAGMDVTVIARGKHLEAIQNEGLKMRTTSRGDFTVYPVQAFDMEHYSGRPDVIFVCVKGYSLEETIPFIEKAAHGDTVVIPILNLYGTGSRMQARLPGTLVTDGCIYIAAEIGEPGTIIQKGDIFRIVFGVRQPEQQRPALEQVVRDLAASGISSDLSPDIKKDAMKKFALISPMAACGAFYEVEAGAYQKEGPERDTLVSLIHEILELSRAMGIELEADMDRNIIALIDGILPTATASMQRDIMQGRESEIDGLVFEVVRMGREYGVDVPCFAMVAEKFGFTLQGHLHPAVED